MRECCPLLFDMPITRMLRGPRTVAQTGQAIVCAALALEAEIIGRQFEAEFWSADTADISAFVSRAANDGCRGIVSYGFAGGLSPQLRCGDIVVGSEVIGPNGTAQTDDIWSAWLLSTIPGAVYGPIAGADTPISTSVLRNELGLGSGALAVDMESHVIARLAAANRMRFVALRVVIDAAQRNVPFSALGCVSSRGETSRWRLGRLLLQRPSDAPDVMRLWTDWWLASKVLRSCSEVLGDSVRAIEL